MIFFLCVERLYNFFHLIFFVEKLHDILLGGCMIFCVERLRDYLLRLHGFFMELV